MPMLTILLSGDRNECRCGQVAGYVAGTGEQCVTSGSEEVSEGENQKEPGRA